jgi:hypothetical protein
MNTTQRNEGEGNKTAAREYNKAQEAFVKSGKVKPAADAAKKSLDGPEADDMEDAAEKGRSPGKNAPEI